jgi:hypothetical protein
MSIANDLLIGSNHAGTPATPSSWFNGVIDEFAIYNRALTTNEVTQHYQTATTAGGRAYAALIKTDLESKMSGQNSSAYLRIPFVVNDVSAVDRLTLRIKYDDGFVAYINGSEAASANAADTNPWNAAATARHTDKAAMDFVEFDLGEARGALLPGTNILAIHGLNISASNPDFLIHAELIATSFGAMSADARYFTLPTPGSINGVGAKDVGPIIGAVNSIPALPVRPLDTEDITVTARVTPSFAPLGTVTLRWRVMYGVTNSVQMLDDGLHGDGVAGDRIFGAVIPANASTNGQMVRYYVTANDTLGRSSLAVVRRSARLAGISRHRGGQPADGHQRAADLGMVRLRCCERTNGHRHARVRVFQRSLLRQHPHPPSWRGHDSWPEVRFPPRFSLRHLGRTVQSRRGKPEQRGAGSLFHPATDGVRGAASGGESGQPFV